METLSHLKLKPTMVPEGFPESFESGRNCKRIQYEYGAFFVFRPLTLRNETYKYDLVITQHGVGHLQWRAECPECRELFEGSKQLASHMWHIHKSKLSEAKSR